MIKMNKFNEKLNSKLTKTKLFKRGVALALAATTVGSLAGCGKKAPLEDTILENSVVALVDGDYEILKVVKSSYCYVTDDSNIESSYDHQHYQNVVTNEYLVDNEDCRQFIIRGVWENQLAISRYAEITDIKSITDYLTEEELKKANDGSLTDEDIIKIVARIKALPVEDAKENQKSK